jgi:hypothetical protein
MIERTYWFKNVVRYSVCSFQHTLKYMYLGVIRSRPTAYSKVTIKHNHLDNKHINQNEKCNVKISNIKFIKLSFIHCTCEFD